MAKSEDEAGHSRRDVLSSLHNFIDSNLRSIRTGLYVVCGVGVVIIARSIYVTRVFSHAEDIPSKFLRSHMRLLGRAREVTDDGLIRIQHIPPLKNPFKRQIQEECLKVKLACLDISPEGKLWLTNNVKDRKVWFKLLHRNVSILHCSVEIPKILRNQNINETLMKKGLCKVSSMEHIEGEYSTVTTTNKTLLDYLDRMVYLESRAASKEAGMWKVNKPLGGSWRTKGVHVIKSVLSSPINLLRWVYRKARRSKDGG